MSSLIVPVVKLEKVEAHPKADRLELTQVKGWTIVIPKGQYKAGDEVIYIPVDACLTDEYAEKWGVKPYLKKGNRVRAARFRGIVSYGFIVDNEINAEIGENVYEQFGITKYEPPIKVRAGDAETPHPRFFKYTDIENIRNFPNVFTEDDIVVVTEKIHGTNCRIGLIREEDEDLYAVGSHMVRRKLECGSVYETPLEPLKDLLNMISDLNDKADVTIYCEIYGAKVQDLKYGLTNSTDFRIFDLMINGAYQSYTATELYLSKAASEGLIDSNVKYVPVLYRGPFSMEKMEELAKGKTTLMSPEEAHMREGIVIKTNPESTHIEIGRKILKMLSEDYLLRKDGTENH